MWCVSEICVCRGGYVVLINPPPYYHQSADQFTVQLTVTDLLMIAHRLEGILTKHAALS